MSVALSTDDASVSIECVVKSRFIVAGNGPCSPDWSEESCKCLSAHRQKHARREDYGVNRRFTHLICGEFVIE